MSHDTQPPQEGGDADTRGLFTNWVDSAIANPKKVYRAMFATVGLFFLFTTLFPLYWLTMIAFSDGSRVSEGVGLLPTGFDPTSFIEIFQQVPFHLYLSRSSSRCRSTSTCSTVSSLRR